MFDHFESSEHDSTPIKTILVVDEDVQYRNAFADIMAKDTTYQAIIAANHVEALEITGIIKPHLFLLNDQLPTMDGLTLCNLLHKMKGLEIVPAVILRTGTKAITCEIEKGNILILQKPGNPWKLLSIIDEMVQDVQARFSVVRYRIVCSPSYA